VPVEPEEFRELGVHPDQTVAPVGENHAEGGIIGDALELVPLRLQCLFALAERILCLFPVRDVLVRAVPLHDVARAILDDPQPCEYVPHRSIATNDAVLDGGDKFRVGFQGVLLHELMEARHVVGMYESPGIFRPCHAVSSFPHGSGAIERVEGIVEDVGVCCGIELPVDDMGKVHGFRQLGLPGPQGLRTLTLRDV